MPFQFPPHRILLAVESAELARPALLNITPLAAQGGAVVDLLHIWEPIPFTPPDAAFYQTGAVKSYRDIAVEEGTRELDSLCDEAAKLGVAIGKKDIHEGIPAQSILEFAEQRGIDLIVVTSHKRHGARRWLQGSVSEKVAQGAPCPVLVVPKAP